MPYPGGKSGGGCYQRIINQMPPHSLYVEACLGGGAVMKAKRPANRNVGVDLDGDALAEFANLGRDVELYQADVAAWLRHEFGLYRFPVPGGAAGFGVHGLTGFGCVESSPGKVAGSRGEGLQAGPPLLTTGAAPGRDAVVYIDPPYPLDARRTQAPIYRFEMTNRQHEELLEVIVRLPCYVIVSGYDHPLYVAALQGWRRLRFAVQTRGGRMAIENLWCNFPEPAILHDHRFLGDEKRERERIRRKAKKWTEGLKRLPSKEQAAILEMIRCELG